MEEYAICIYPQVDPTCISFPFTVCIWDLFWQEVNWLFNYFMGLVDDF